MHCQFATILQKPAPRHSRKSGNPNPCHLSICAIAQTAALPPQMANRRVRKARS
ncbi:MAG: hypothetical protein ACR2P4_03440 [Gammaproteobacteria bacterium]